MSLRFKSALLGAVFSYSVLMPDSALSAPAREEATVLGFEAESTLEEDAADLRLALRKELGRRGFGVSNETSLVELKLTMGCEDGDRDCIVEGGRALETPQLVYGSIEKSDEAYSIELMLITVDDGKVVTSMRRRIDAVDFADQRAVAQLLADGLFGADPNASEDLSAAPETDTSPDRDQGKLVWGKEENTPAWKKIALGFSAGLALASVGTAVGSTLAIRENGPIHNDLLDAARDSLTDDNPINDIDPETDEDLCELAQQEPEPGKVRNGEMTKLCLRSEALSLTATATWISFGVFAASTVVFSTLYFVHRENNPQSALLGKHQLRLGVGPTRHGGWSVGGSLRF